MKTRLLFGVVAALMTALCLEVSEAAETQDCRIVRERTRVELHSPLFVFRLDTAAGLRAVSWENRLTGRNLPLGNGPEVEFDIGLPEGPLQTPRLEVVKVEVNKQDEMGEVVFQLAAREPAASAVVTYRWDAKQPVLRKFVTIRNDSRSPWNRLLNVRLGRYKTGGVEVIDKPSGGTYSVPAPRAFPSAGSTHVERGFPVYVDGQFFFALAHPAGAAEGSGGKVSLRQYPGVTLAPAKTFECMEAVYGVAKAGAARQAFMAHLQSRMRARFQVMSSPTPSSSRLEPERTAISTRPRSFSWTTSPKLPKDNAKRAAISICIRSTSGSTTTAR